MEPGNPRTAAAPLLRGLRADPRLATAWKIRTCPDSGRCAPWPSEATSDGPARRRRPTTASARTPEPPGPPWRTRGHHREPDPVIPGPARGVGASGRGGACPGPRFRRVVVSARVVILPDHPVLVRGELHRARPLRSTSGISRPARSTGAPYVIIRTWSARPRVTCREWGQPGFGAGRARRTRVLHSAPSARDIADSCAPGE